MPIEDVYVTGLLAKIIGGVHHVPLGGFLVEQPTGCDIIEDRVTTGNHVCAERMLAVWEKLQMQNKTGCT